MGRRIYKSGFDNVTIGTATQDLWTLLAGATNGIQLHWLQLSAAAVTTAAEIRMRLKRGTATVTVTGGTSPAMNLVDSGDTKAAGSSVTCNNTTVATTSGNFTGFVEYFQWNVLLPWDYMPGPEDEDRPACLPAQAFILDLAGATIASTVVSSNASWREYP